MGLSSIKHAENGGANRNLYTLFTYSTRHLNKSDKIRFYYALKGRDGKSGLVHRTGCKQLGKTVLLVPIMHEDEFIDFLNYWKCKFEKRRIKLLDDSQN